MLKSPDEDQIWAIVQKIKSDTSFGLDCDWTGVFAPTVIESQVLKVEEELKINSTTSLRLPSMQKSKLKTAAEMFLYLNICPDPLKPWFLFYKDLFQNEPEMIVLTLNRLIKRSGNHQNVQFNSIGKQLFEKVSEVFSLKYKEIHNKINGIESVTTYHNSNTFEGNKCRIYEKYIECLN